MWPHRRGRPLCLPEQQMPTTNTQCSPLLWGGGVRGGSDRNPSGLYSSGERADTGVCPYTLNLLFMEKIILIILISFQ